MSTETVSRNERRIVTKRRYWQRTKTAKPLWPWGLLPMCGLALLFLFGALVTAPQIQAEVRQKVADRFDAAGVGTGSVNSNGQGVTVLTESTTVDRQFLNALAKSTECQTWAGSLTCPTSVALDVKQHSVQPEAVAARPHALTVLRDNSGVRLTGEVPDMAEHDRIVGRAGQQFTAVTNELTITNEQASNDYSRAADTSLEIVKRLDGGQAVWSGKDLSVSGITDANTLASVRSQFDNFGSGAVLGQFDVQAINESANCNEQFDSILGASSIRFQTSSATIDAGNAPLLQQLADVAQKCTGVLTIEGHTDSRGDPQMNRALSLARAQAVGNELARLGIDASRLNASGLGAIQPVADNATAAGRAKNRRIAIIVESDATSN